MIPIRVALLRSSLAPWLAKYHLEIKSTIYLVRSTFKSKVLALLEKIYQVSSYHPMHASFHFINQILKLAYITQAYKLNLRTYAMQAGT